MRQRTITVYPRYRLQAHRLVSAQLWQTGFLTTSTEFIPPSFLYLLQISNSYRPSPLTLMQKLSAPSDFPYLWQTGLLAVPAKLLTPSSLPLSISPSSSNIYHIAGYRTSRVVPQFSPRYMFSLVDEVTQACLDVNQQQ